MTTVYRLVWAGHAADALSGEGARRYGGRWNPPGQPVVYASESRALAVLESFVHITRQARAMRFLLYAITLPQRARIRRHEAAVGDASAIPESQAAGRTWLDDGTDLALAVPSVIVPQERNYVLNVRHRQFARLRVSDPERFSFDERLWRSRSPV